MSSDDRETIKRAAVNRIAREPFLHILLTATISGVVYLSVNDRGQYIPWLVGVGLVSVIIAGIGICADWIASRLEKMVASGEKIADAYYSLAQRDKVMTQFVMAISSELHKHRRLVLLIEDNPIHQQLIRSSILHLIEHYDLSFCVANTLEEGIAHVREARVAIIDVTLADNDSTHAVNMIMELVGKDCQFIIHSGTEFTKRDFPRAVSVLVKGDAINEDGLVDSLRKAILATEPKQ
jgi:CheY-like chemotaxis protein